MIFKGLKLKSFRNFSEALVPFSSKVNVFLGENGHGKTNLLESLYLISQGETFRYGDNETLISYDKTESFIQTKILDRELEYSLKLNFERSRKTFFLNEKKTSAAQLRKKFFTVIFSPESLASIKEGADHRRTLVDDFLGSYNTANLDLLAEFKKCLRTRNRILKNHSENVSSTEQTMALLESIEPIYIDLATKLTIERTRALRSILEDFNTAMKYISKQPNVDLSVEYVISGQNALHFSTEQVCDAIQKRLNELTAAELSSGATLVGPHKHDIVFLYDQKDSRFYCSQGQQRAIILSFKMAQIVYHRKVHGVYPVLMLDDVLSELDKNKRDALVMFLNEIQTQIFITTTDFNLPSSFPIGDISVLKIESGKIIS